ncbi:MAG: carboxypeptidase regulatory-like domain-containing protein, partial [Phycisphaerae bacterium]|nr:carboxypeptidase regulatory-like domain-containing protein [Phycisphaerae bacterium]
AASLLEQIELTRLRGAQGNSTFSWSSFTFWNDYLTTVYTSAVPTPTMPWKVAPTTAIIHGFITQPGGEPVVDAHVTRTGDAGISLSTGDGFYSILLVPPGTYTLTASHMAHAGEPTAVVSVGPGDVIRQDLELGALLPPVIAEVVPDPDAARVATNYTRQLALSQGSADTWTLVAGPSRATVSRTGIVHWYPTALDAGHSYTFAAEASNAAGSDQKSWQVLVDATPCSTFRIADFDQVTTGAEYLFRRPRLSGTTIDNLTETPNVAMVTDAVPAFSGAKCYKVQWQFVDTTDQRWMRLATWDAPGLPNPIIELGRPIRIRLRLDSGQLRIAVGVREIDGTGELGSNGGTAGTIEWIGATHTVSGAPQGVLVEPMPGVWQTLVFHPRIDPILGFTGSGTLSSPNGMGTLEELSITIVDTAGPFTLYIDDIDLLCDTMPFGDLDADGDSDLTDFNTFAACFNGPNRPPTYASCDRADFDADNDVDLADFAIFAACFNGPNRPPTRP